MHEKQNLKIVRNKKKEHIKYKIFIIFANNQLKIFFLTSKNDTPSVPY